jgi:diglucosylglycerate octanoyltransferase
VEQPVVLVLGDSLAFHGPLRAEPADEPRLWPNVAAAALGARAEIVAGTGWTSRHAWHALTSDPRVWAVLPAARALVLGVGGMDTLPSPLPTALRELIPVLRPDALRRHVRAGYLRAQPVLARAFAAALPGGGPVALPPRLTLQYLERCRSAVLAVRPDLPVVAVLPPPHRADCYARVHPGRAPAERATRTWARSTGVALLDLPALVTEHVLGGHGNPDGLHWGWDAHAAVGAACAALLDASCD